MNKIIITFLSVAIIGTGIAYAIDYNIQTFYGQCIASKAYVTIGTGSPVKYNCTNGTIKIEVNPYVSMPVMP